MVGRWVSFWDSLFSGAMLNFGGGTLITSQGKAQRYDPCNEKVDPQKKWPSFLDNYPVKYQQSCNDSGQIIATSHDLTPNGGLVREIPLFQGNLGWWNIIIWPEWFTWCFSTIFSLEDGSLRWCHQRWNFGILGTRGRPTGEEFRTTPVPWNERKKNQVVPEPIKK